MATYVALLRGVNVGGRNPIPMARLRALFESLGCEAVSTYIQSGNVIFSSSRAPTPAVFERGVEDELGVRSNVVLRSATELARVVGANPFTGADPATLHVGFLAEKPAAARAKALDATAFAPEECALHGRELYLHLPNGMGRAKLPAHVDRQLRVPTTVRNWKTVTKLVDLTR